MRLNSKRIRLAGSRLRSKLARWPLALLAVLVLTSFGRCSGEAQLAGLPGYTMVLVHVDGAAAGLETLRVTASLNGTPAHNLERIDTRLDLFVVYVPVELQGQLLIDAAGLAADQCKIATGQSSLSIQSSSPDSAPAPIEVSLTLVATATKLCTLSVTLVGNGQVVSDPAGLQCNKAGVCSQEFPAATRVKLHSAPSPGNVATWSGDCSGSGDCIVAVDRLRQATIRFAPPPCTGWCAYTPLPQSNSLRGLWGTGASNVWAVGLLGTIV